MARIEIVDRVSECKRVVRSLLEEEFIAVDAEGVNMSRTGPLTLLQVATSQGQVFLFDVQQEPGMFRQGGLKELLESDRVIKVLQSARNDAQALYYQFGVELQHVHDTQLAFMEVQRSQGRRLLARPKLEEVVQEYCPEKLALVQEDKDSVQTKWNKTEGEFWAKRPLTPEMKKYASNDVIAMVPEVYLEQKRVVKEKGIRREFERRMKEELLEIRDDALKEQLRAERKEMENSILKDMAARVSSRTVLADIQDPDELEAMRNLSLRDLKKMRLPRVITDLMMENIQNFIREKEDELRIKGDDCEPSKMEPGKLRFIIGELEDGPLKQTAQQLMNQLDRIILKDMERKYNTSTPLTNISRLERNVIKFTLRPKSENDPSVHPVLLRFLWAARLEDLENNIAKFKANPASFSVNNSYVKMLKYYLSGPVPAKLKERGTWFLRELQSCGKVQRPQNANRRR